MQRILFIGGGNMTRAMVGGLIKDNYPAQALIVLDRHGEKRDFFSKQWGVTVADALQPDLFDAEIIVLSVKPQGAAVLCAQLKSFLEKPVMILSVMAGISIHALAQWFGKDLPIVRAMPNTPAQEAAGAAGLFANTLVSAEQKTCVKTLLSSVGIVAWLSSESELDIITALSGSGPAYFFYLIEAMQQAAVKMGLSEEIAALFAKQTAYGAAILALKSNESVAILRNQVTSKGGTTAAALSVLNNQHFFSIISDAMLAAQKRSEELSQTI